MTQIQRGENVFAAMRIILPEHRAMMMERETGTKDGGQNGEPDEAAHPFLDEFVLQEAGELLAAANEEGFAVRIRSVMQKNGRAQVWTGTAQGLDSREQSVGLLVEGRLRKIPVIGLMSVEKAEKG